MGDGWIQGPWFDGDYGSDRYERQAPLSHEEVQEVEQSLSSLEKTKKVNETVRIMDFLMSLGVAPDGMDTIGKIRDEQYLKITRSKLDKSKLPHFNKLIEIFRIQYPKIGVKNPDREKEDAIGEAKRFINSLRLKRSPEYDMPIELKDHEDFWQITNKILATGNHRMSWKKFTSICEEKSPVPADIKNFLGSGSQYLEDFIQIVSSKN